MPILQHAEALLPLAAGVGFTWLGFVSTVERTVWTKRILRTAGPALVLLGCLFLLTRSTFQPQWERHGIDGGRASAEFPGLPAEQTVTETAGLVSVPRRTLLYNVPGRDVSLRLSISPLPIEIEPVTEAARVDATIAAFAQQGFVLQTRTAVPSPAATIHRLDLRWAEKRVTLRVLLGYARGKVYRAMSTTVDGHADSGIDDRFLASFRIEGRAPAEPKPSPGASPYGGAVAAILQLRPHFASVQR